MSGIPQRNAPYSQLGRRTGQEQYQAEHRGREPPLQTMPANGERTVPPAPYPGQTTSALAPAPEREPEPEAVTKPAKAKRVRRKAGDVPANKPAAPTKSRGKKGGAGTSAAAAAAGADAAEGAGGNGVVAKGRERGRPRNSNGLDEAYEWFPGQFQWYHTFTRLVRLFPDISRKALHCLLEEVDGDIVRAIDNVHFIRTCLSGGYADIILEAHPSFQAQYQTVPRPLFRAPLKQEAPIPPRVHAQAVVQPHRGLNVSPQPVKKNIHPAEQVVNGTGDAFQPFTIISSREGGLKEISSLPAMFELVATQQREISIMMEDLGGSLDIMGLRGSGSQERVMPIFNYSDDESALSPAYHEDPKFDGLYSPSLDLRLSDTE